jgi:hypothetical protein
MEKIRIRDPGWKKSRIRDREKHSGSATLFEHFIIFEYFINKHEKKQSKKPRLKYKTNAER